MKLWKLAGAALHRFVTAALRDRLPQDHFNDLDPAEYEDQQFSEWYAHLDTVLRDSGISRFTCTCGHSGKELELVQKRHKGAWYPTCPSCGGFEYQRLVIPDRSKTHFTIDRYEGLTKDYVDRMAEQSPVQPSDFADRDYIRSQRVTPAEEQFTCPE